MAVVERDAMKAFLTVIAGVLVLVLIASAGLAIGFAIFGGPGL